MMRSSLRIVLGIALAAVAGCEPAHSDASSNVAAADVVAVEGAAPAGALAPEQFDLEGPAAVIRDHRVKDGKTLEVQINGNRRNRVDVDHDGKRDRLQVVEIRGERTRTFQVRALPSSQKKAKPDDVAVVVAAIEVEPADDAARVTVRYADTVHVVEPVVIVFDEPIVVDTFCAWVLIVDRPIFVGVGYVIVYERAAHEKYKKHKK
jgi:hypothetical protein